MASAAFNKEVLVLKLSPITRQCQTKEKKKLCLGKCFLASKNNGEFNREMKKMIFVGCRSNFSLPLKTLVARAAFSEVMVLRLLRLPFSH